MFFFVKISNNSYYNFLNLKKIDFILMSKNLDYDLLLYCTPQNNHSIKMIENLLSKKADPNAMRKEIIDCSDWNGENYIENENVKITPFNLICQKEIASKLLETFLNCKANASIKDTSQNTAFHHLCANPRVNVEMIEMILENNKNIKMIENAERMIPFQLLLQNEKVNINMIKLFYNKKYFSENQDPKNKSFLLLASQNRNISSDILNFLVSNSDVNFIDHYERDAFYYLCDLNSSKLNLNLLSSFIENGLDLNKFINGETPLHRVFFLLLYL